MAATDCELVLNGITQDCETAAGGIARIFLAPRINMNAGTYTDPNETPYCRALETLTAVTGVTAPVFKEYAFREDTAYYTVTAVRNSTGRRVVGWTTVLHLEIDGMSQDKDCELQNLSRVGIVAIVIDNNGVARYLGGDRTLVLTETTAIESGTVFGDNNGYIIELDTTTAYAPPIIEEAIYTPLITAATGAAQPLSAPSVSADPEVTAKAVKAVTK